MGYIVSSAAGFMLGFFLPTGIPLMMLVPVVSAGIDAVYSPSWFNWAGLYAGADINLAWSLARGARRTYRENCGGSSGTTCTARPAEAGEPSNLTTHSLQIMLGLFAQF